MTGGGQNDLFQLGVIVGTHGLRGDLKVRTQASDSTSLAEARELLLRRPTGGLEVFAVERAVPHKGGWLVHLRGRHTLEAVEDLVGCELLMRYADLPALDEDEFYWYQLKGLSVVDRTLGDLGKVTDLLPTAAHDIYVVQGSYGEVLIPAVAAFVLDIDPESGRMTVDLPAGLVSETDEV